MPQFTLFIGQSVRSRSAFPITRRMVVERAGRKEFFVQHGWANYLNFLHFSLGFSITTLRGLHCPCKQQFGIWPVFTAFKGLSLVTMAM